MGVLAEVERALEEIRKDPVKQALYQHIFSKYPPAFVLDCERQVMGSAEMVERWLRENMLADRPDPISAAKKARQGLMDYEGTTEHAHHFMIDKCAELGLEVVPLEADQDLQEDILSVHHAFVATFAHTDALKIIENGNGQNWVVTN
ncbi:MAG: hypothetical protein AAFY35_16470 [Pseudomonadota bacterium]